MQKDITVTINDKKVTVKSGTSIYNACKQADIYVPSICNHRDLPPAGKCGVCIVKVNSTQYVLACSTKCVDGMVIETSSNDVREKSLAAFDNFSDMPLYPTSPETLRLMEYFSKRRPKHNRKVESSKTITYDPKLCLNCFRCERACRDIQTITVFDNDNITLLNSDCISCGLCVSVCPTGALSEKNSRGMFLKALGSGKLPILLIDFRSIPLIQSYFSDSRNFKNLSDGGHPNPDIKPTSTVLIQNIIGAAKEMGFHYVFNTVCGFKMTVYEDMNQILHHNGDIPIFSSSCPAWVNFVEKVYPDFIPCLSTAKSPEQMLASAVRSQLSGDLFIVTLTQCIAMKDETSRSQLAQGVDCTMTFHEFALLINRFEIPICQKSAEFDPPFDESPFSQYHSQSEAIAELLKSKRDAFKYKIIEGVATMRDILDQKKYIGYDYIEVWTSCGRVKCSNYSQGSEAKKENQMNEILHENLNICGSKLRTSFEPKTVKKSEKRGVFSICYGTTTGTALNFAIKLAKQVDTVPIAMNLCTFSPSEDSILIIIVSTFGEGEFPLNAKKFVSKLPMDCSRIKYAIVALGSSEYNKFCASGHILDSIIEKRGGHRITETLELDSATNDLLKREEEFTKWALKVANLLGITLCELPLASNCTLSKISNLSTEHKPIGYDWGKVTKRISLNDHLIEYEIQLPLGMSIPPSGTLEILPKNDPIKVEKLLKIMNLDPNSVLGFSSESLNNLIPESFTVQSLFEQYLELSAPPNHALIRAFYQCCSNPVKREILKSYLQPHTEIFQKYTVYEFIEEFSDAIPSLEMIITTCPLMRPRIYSIFSLVKSPQGQHTGKFLITNDLGGKIGVCTSFLERSFLQQIAVKADEEPYFTYTESPMLIVATSSGISPMIQILTEYEAEFGTDKLQDGHILLIFSCKSDLIFKQVECIEIQSIKEKMGEFFIVGEETPGDLLMKDGIKDKVWNLWKDMKTELFYCGPGKGLQKYVIEAIKFITNEHQAEINPITPNDFHENHLYHIEAY